MKPSDLMVGDWVMYNPNIFIEDEYEPTKKEYPTQIQSGEDIDLVIEGCYKPIPLTPEILEKNEFEHQRNIGYIFEDGYGGKVIYATFDNTLKIFRNYDMLVNITFFDRIAVHELQHALKLCGIEKEIVL